MLVTVQLVRPLRRAARVGLARHRRDILDLRRLGARQALQAVGNQGPPQRLDLRRGNALPAGAGARSKWPSFYAASRR